MIILYPLQRRDFILAASVSFLGLTLYIRTLAPGLLTGDSAEFQTLAYTLGMTHPTGYPVYVFLTRLFTLMPLGGMAWRVNLFSALWGALTLALVYLILRMLVEKRIAAVAGAFVLAVTPLFWVHSLVAELYAPASGFISLILFLMLLWRKTDHPRYLYAAGLLGGLGLGIHSMVALLLPAVLVYLMLTLRSHRIWMRAIGWGLLGVLLTLTTFLILDSIDAKAGYYHVTVRHALSIWGMTGSDFDTPLERLRFLLFPKQFSGEMFSSDRSFLMQSWQTYRSLLFNDLGWLGIGLCLGGAGGLMLFRGKEFLLLTISWVTQTAFALNYKVGDYVVFFTTGFIFLSIFAGTGLGLFMELIDRLQMPAFRLERPAFRLSIIAGLLILGVLVNERFLMISHSWSMRKPTFVETNDLAVYRYLLDDPEIRHQRVLSLVDSLEEDAIIFSEWADVYPFYFVAYLEEGRTEMDFFEAYPQAEGLASSTADYISSNLGIRPIYFTVEPPGGQAKKFVFASVSKAEQELFEVVGEK